MINRAVIVGRLTKDPVLGQAGSGIAYCRFTVAITRPFSGNNGEKETDFIPCIAWRKQAENLCNFMKKGSLVGVEGRMQSGQYQNNDGKTVYTLDLVADSIQFYDSRGSGNGGQQNQNQGQSQPQYAGASQQNGPSQNYGGQPSSNQQYGGGQSSSNQQYGGGGQQNYTRVDEDPFANSKGPIEVSEDDLPF